MSVPDAGPWDLLIRSATVYDGSGSAPSRADVAVAGDRIAAVGELAGTASTTIDARDLALAPGFIDVHSHDDFALVLNPEMDFKVMQGVTSDVVGNCGMGAAPFEAAAPMASAFHPGKTLRHWDGYAGYMRALEAEPPSLNGAVLVGHGTLRAAAMGGAQRAPEPAELARMCRDLREGLEAGAVGYSTGLIYEPGRHARTEELAALAREMGEIGGLYATHMRDEGAGLLDSVREAIAIGEAGGVPVQISHHKATGRENWGLVAKSLGLIERARERGLDVTADQYPYTAGSTILRAIVQHDGFTESRGLDPADVVISSAPSHPECDGKSVAVLASQWGMSARDAVDLILQRDPGALAIMHSMNEDDVQTVMRHPSTMIGSDGIPSEAGKPHPRLYGTFARVLGHYARDLGLLPLEEAIWRMTGLPAAKFRLTDRGAIRPGAYADLVLFDPAKIADESSYEDPRRHPSGIDSVFVNGTAVVSGGAHTGARPGRVLRRGEP